MNKWINKRNWIVSLSILGILGIAVPGCAEMPKASSASYPSKMTSIRGGDTTTVMYRMGAIMGDLESYVSAGPVNDPEVRQDILRKLDQLKSIAKSIREGGTVTHHRRIDENIDDFIADIDRAREAAGRTNPDYYYIGRLAGACNACHLMN